MEPNEDIYYEPIKEDEFAWIERLLELLAVSKTERTIL
jgi:hypothetical protein